MLILDYLFFKGMTEFVWYLILAAGVVAFVASFVLKMYKFPLQIVGTLIMILSIYNLGMVANEAKWEARMEEAKSQLKAAEIESTAATQKLEQALTEKKELASQKNKEVIKYVDKWRTKEVLKEVPVNSPERVRVEQVVKYIENCPVPKEMIDLHNKGAQKPNNNSSKGDKK